MASAPGVAVYRKEARKKRDQQRYERNQLQEQEGDKECQGYEEPNSHRELIMKAHQKGLEFLLPVDVVVADRFAPDANSKVVDHNEVLPGWRIMDIGPATIAVFRQALEGAETIVWNGTLGVAEMPAFAKGTNAIIETLVERTREGATTIIGGGDSAAAVEQAGVAEKMTHVSTGGGASLEFLEGRVLPGVAALQDKEQ